jgi:hypothetical protein
MIPNKNVENGGVIQANFDHLQRPTLKDVIGYKLLDTNVPHNNEGDSTLPWWA